jgi:hypothetical protein
MATRGKPRRFRPAAALCFGLLAPLWLAAQQQPKIPPIRQYTKFPPEVAATHLTKKVAPIYPAFAKAAGIEGIVSVGVAIFPDGRVHAITSRPAGWACLQEPAMTAATQYVYRPFMKDGHAVGVQTTEDIVFKLPGHRSAFHPPPPPELTLDSFLHSFQNAAPVADGPPEIRKWVVSQMRKDFSYSFPAKQGAWKGLKYGLPAKMVEIPTGVLASRIYIIIDNVESPSTGYSLCGNGGCDIWWVVDDAGTVRDGFRSGGWGFYVRRRKGSPYPDIFTAGTTGPGEVDVDGYVNVGGYWGLLYCGTIEGGIHVCR